MARQGGCALRRGDDFLEVLSDRLVRPDLIGEEFGVAEDGGQHVVEVVRHAAGELADRFHFLRMPQLFFERVLRLRALAALDGLAQLPGYRRHQARQAIFHQEIRRAGLERRDRGFLAHSPRHHDQRDVGAAPVQDFERGRPAEARHAVVGQHEVPGLAHERRFHGLRRVHAQRGDIVAALRQRVNQQLGVGGGVLDQQHVQRRARRRQRRVVVRQRSRVGRRWSRHSTCDLAAAAAR